MKPPRTPSRIEPVATRLRRQIELAEAEGIIRGDMILKLTRGDVHQLKRDPSLPVADISYDGGVMRYLGVMIEQGGVAESSLSRGGGE